MENGKLLENRTWYILPEPSQPNRSLLFYLFCKKEEKREVCRSVYFLLRRTSAPAATNAITTTAAIAMYTSIVKPLVGGGAVEGDAVAEVGGVAVGAMVVGGAVVTWGLACACVTPRAVSAFDGQ